MAKGKHKRRREQRDQSDTHARIEQLWRLEQSERDRRDTAEAAAADVRELQEQLAQATAGRDRAASREMQHLEGLIGDLVAAHAELTPLVDTLRRHWNQVSGSVLDRYGHDNAGWEVLCRAVGIDAHVTDGVAAVGLSRARAATLQQARGARSGSRATSVPGDLRRQLPYARLRELIDPSVVPDVDDDLAAEIDAAQQDFRIRDDEEALLRAAPNVLGTDAYGWLSQNPAVLRAWHPTPWLSNGAPSIGPFAPVAADDATAVRWLTDDGDVAPLTDPAWQRLWARDRTVAEAGYPHWDVLDPPTRTPRPADSIWIRATYSRAAQAVAQRHTARLPGVASPVSAIGAQVYETAARTLAHATPFWLPPAQAAGYAASDALAPDAALELRLPVPAALLVFADPLVVTPDPAAPERVRAGAAEADQAAAYARAQLKDTHNRLSKLERLVEATPRAWFAHDLTPDDLIRARGGLVEAVLLCSDLDGQLTDRVVWCVAVPTADGAAVLGRIAIPGSRTRTSWRTELENFAAAAAWGDWHRPVPDDDRSGDDADELTGRQAAQLAMAGADVHVLDVRTSSSATRVAALEEPSGRKLRPHLRRGHWKRVRYGPGRRQTRWARIAPTLVNASRSDLEPTVYRLPHDTAAWLDRGARTAP